MNDVPALKPGRRVAVLWGLSEPRAATVLEVWGDPRSPSQVRVQLDALEDEVPTVLLLSPDALAPAA